LDLEIAVYAGRLIAIAFFGLQKDLIPRLLRCGYEDYGEGDPDSLSAQLNTYLNGEDPRFSVALRLYGTPFQIAVWKGCMRIPFGQTRSYRELARMAGYPRAFRAVGSAMAKNPLPLIIPCHRVIRSDGQTGGFAGGSALKTALLNHEKGLK